MIWILTAIIILLLAVIITMSKIIISLQRNGIQPARMSISWVLNAVQGKTNVRFFEANQLYKIGIIGYNSYTYALERELSGTDIKIAFCLDSRFQGLPPIPGMTFINADEFAAHKDEVDALVDVFPPEVRECQEERKAIKAVFEGKCVPLEDLIYYTSELKGKD